MIKQSSYNKFKMNSGYWSDSENSIISHNSFDSSDSSNSSNYIKKMKQEYLNHNYNQHKINSLRKRQTQKKLEQHRNKTKYKNYMKNNENSCNNTNNELNSKIIQKVGSISGFDKNTPFIDYLINKRINFCVLGSSSHIAAFVPVVNNSWYCFIREWKGKGHYG